LQSTASPVKISSLAPRADQRAWDYSGLSNCIHRSWNMMMTMAESSDYKGPRTFTDAVSICLTGYATFRGRAPRSEYWYFTLFTFLVEIVASILDVIIFGFGHGFLGLINLAFIIPGLAVLVRRLHDIDRSGWWWLIALIPLVGWIILLVWLCTRGTYGPNRYGTDPLD
jgi:uncharacterized membrane protein YhaH (DUF805 family)